MIAGAVPAALCVCRALFVAGRSVPPVVAPVAGAIPVSFTRARPIGLARPVSSTRRGFLAVAGDSLPIAVARAVSGHVACASTAADAESGTSVLAVLPPGSIRTGTVRGVLFDHTSTDPAALVQASVLASFTGVSRLTVAVDRQPG